MNLQVLRNDGTEVQPGDEVVSRTGEVWFLIAAARASTPEAFGKIAVRRPLRHSSSWSWTWSTPFESGSVFTDFAFGVTVRQVP